MRDPQLTGYTPHATAGVTPVQRIDVDTSAIPCDGGGSGGHPRVWLRIEDLEVTCPYCSITYVLRDGVGDGYGH